MNILYICPRFPYPPDQGDKVVIYNHIRFLSRTNEITLLSFIQDKKELEWVPYLSDYCTKIEVFKKRPNFSFLNFILAFYKTDPFTVIRYYSPKMLKRSKELIESGRFDVVHTAFYYMGQYVINKEIVIPNKTVAILDTHNIEYLIHSTYAGLVRNPIIKLFMHLEALRLKRYELPIYKRFDRCLAFSKLDEGNIVRLSGVSNIIVNPACIEASPDQKGTQGQEEEDTLIFFGGLRYIANDDAVRFFYRDIFPLIKQQAPNVRLIIAGKSPSRYIKALNRDPKVRVEGLVSDIRALLKKVAVVIVPLRLGGGTRMKILESWTVSKAVVSTSIGAEGVETTDGADILIADSISDFARKVIALLKDKAMRERIGQAGFRKVCGYYRPDRIIENLERIYQTAREEKLKNG